MKINFGSGGRQIPGYIATDLPEVDITKPLPYADGSVEACLASHVAEHISGPDVLRFVREVNRILVPGGKFRLIIPIIGPWLQIWHARDLCTGHGHLTLWNEELVRTLLWMGGFDQQKIRRVDFDSTTDHHHLTIGKELDAIESLRVEATK